MAIEKKTIIDQIEITRNGQIQIRFGLLLVEDGVELASTWHRTAIDPGGDLTDQLAAVNEHLGQIGKSPIELEKLPMLNSVVKLVHTPEAVAKFRADKAKSSM